MTTSTSPKNLSMTLVSGFSFDIVIFDNTIKIYTFDSRIKLSPRGKISTET